MSLEIDDLVIFKNDSSLFLEVNRKYVGLKIKDKNLFVFNFNVPFEENREIITFFDKIKAYEHVNVDIGHTGEIACYFMGISPIKTTTENNMEYYNFSVILKELKDIIEQPPEDENEGHACPFSIVE